MRRLALIALLLSSPFLAGCDLSSGTLEDDYTPSDRVYESPDPTGPPADFERQQREYEEEQALIPPEGKCADVTSMDNNWDNDVLCTRDDGSQFYTSYDGATQFLEGY